MPFPTRFQTSRFELKYVVSPGCARAIRDFARPHVVPDEHACPDNEHGAYAVHSLYLDTPSLELFQQTERGLKNRFKLRIRFYDDDPAHPAFLEIKRRETDVIRKERAAISRRGVARLLGGDWLRDADLVSDNGNGYGIPGRALQRFCELSAWIRARPAAYVSYMREAYVLPEGNQVRVTFDRELYGSHYAPRGSLSVPPDGRQRPPLGGVILELKFTDRFPGWMQELVRAFDLQRRSVAKYVLCAKALELRPGRHAAVDSGIG